MTLDIDPSEATKVFKAFESGRLDQLFTEANTEYYDREGFNALRFGVGVPRESVWRLISAIRMATGLLVLESAWGDFQVRVTPTAQLMEALYQIDTWEARNMVGKTGLPSDEEWIVQDRLLVEEAVRVALSKTGDGEPTKSDLKYARAEVIATLYDDVPPTSSAGIVAMRFYRTMRSLPDARFRPITPDYITEVHRLLKEGEPDAGMLRASDIPPLGDRASTTAPARIMGELQAMQSYTDSLDVPFVHPLIKALALAWWIRRVQPFDQYNYLVSRLVSMAYALRHGYHVTGILGSPGELKELPQDSGDLTSVMIRQLKVIHASKELGARELERRVVRYKEVTTRFRALGINHRQALILDRALKNPETTFTIKHHARTRELAYETARQDFLRLVEPGYLGQRKKGKAFEFRLAQDAEKKLSKKLT